MDSIRCSECDQTFCSRFNLLRHERGQHSQKAMLGVPGGEYGAPKGAQEVQGLKKGNTANKAMILHHPFTMMISGPTACGKTTFVKDLLQHHKDRIHPEVQRIVWLYKRWQPMYTIIKKSVTPAVEFVQGIPSDLEEDVFFDSRINNLLVVDDLFAEASKDTRITGLFTEGSHHRSLSVIVINQNLFGTKDPTQRRNCHYLVLYQNPVDRQSIMTLARQMYPGDSMRLMDAFSQATKNPYKFLLVDLKTFTPEHKRLRPEVTWLDEQAQHDILSTIQKSDCSIKSDITPTPCYSTVGIQTDDLEQESNMSDDLNPCDDCGLLFETPHDVQRHVKRGWCPESQDRASKKLKVEKEEAIEDNKGFFHLWKLAKKCSKKQYDKLLNRYISDGENDDDAADMAEDRVKPYEERNFFNRYATLLDDYWVPLHNNPVHNKVVQQIDELQSKGTPLSVATKRILRKNKPDFQDLFDVEVPEEKEEVEEEEEEEKEEEEEENEEEDSD